MKKTLKKSLIFLLLFSLAFPIAGALSAPKAAKAKEAQPKFAAAIKIVRPQTESIQVSVRDGSTKILSDKCLALNKQNRNLIQDAMLIDLNQPADCFSLGAASEVMAAELQVKPLAAAMPNVKVLVNLPIISSPAFSSAPARQADPIMPLSVAGLAMAFYAFFRKGGSAPAQTTGLGNHYILTLHQLRIMRC